MNRASVKSEILKRSSRRRQKTLSRGQKILKLSLGTRWRALIRKVINNLGWIAEKTGSKKAHMLDKDEVVTQHDKFLLFKNPIDRNVEDLLSLAHRLSAYKTTRKYSIDLRVVLLRRARYVAHTKSVILIRQGIPLNNVYMLVKGRATAIIESHGDENVQGETEMREGHFIGEYAILYGKTATSSVFTNGPTEWITFNKYVFNTFAKGELKKKYFAVECALSKFNIFDKLKFFEMREYCVSADIIKVEPNTVLSLVDGTVGLTYFILEGRCSVLQTVVLVKDLNLPYPYYKLHSDQEARDPPAETLIVRTCLLSRRAIFGLGEEACRWVIVTDIECSFMVMPRFMLLKYGRNIVLERLKDQLNSAYPPLDLILTMFIENKRWARYRHRLTKSYSRNLSGNDVHDVPLMARCSEMTSDDEDDALKEVDASLIHNEYFSINSKKSLKRLEMHPLLKSLAEYLPKDEIF